MRYRFRTLERPAHLPRIDEAPGGTPMVRIHTGVKDLSYRQPGDPTVEARALCADAAAKDVITVLSADPNETDGDGRSQWVWLRFPNGDLALAVYPQGETYFAVEKGVEESFSEVRA